jgi:hypothetical protein
MKVVNTIICYDYPMYQLSTGKWVAITNKGFQYLEADDPILISALKGVKLGLEELFIPANKEGTVRVQVARCPHTKKWFQRGAESGSWVEFDPKELKALGRFPAASYSSMWSSPNVTLVESVRDSSYFWSEFEKIAV